MNGQLAAGVPADVWPGLGWFGSIVVLGLCLVTFLLWRNMNKQLKRVKVPTEAQLRAADAERRAATARPGTPAGTDGDGPDSGGIGAAGSADALGPDGNPTDPRP